MIDTLSALDSIQVPGTIRSLPYRWSKDHSWKDRVMRPDPDKPDGEHGDNRVARHSTPQYQCAADRLAAASAGGCPSCVFLSE